MPKAKNNVVRELVSRYRALRGFSLVPEEYLTASPYTLSKSSLLKPWRCRWEMIMTTTHAEMPLGVVLNSPLP